MLIGNGRDWLSWQRWYETNFLNYLPRSLLCRTRLVMFLRHHSLSHIEFVLSCCYLGMINIFLFPLFTWTPQSDISLLGTHVNLNSVHANLPFTSVGLTKIYTSLYLNPNVLWTLIILIHVVVNLVIELRGNHTRLQMSFDSVYTRQE
jgi:hypothetical protein